MFSDAVYANAKLAIEGLLRKLHTPKSVATFRSEQPDLQPSP